MPLSSIEYREVCKELRERAISIQVASEHLVGNEYGWKYAAPGVVNWLGDNDFYDSGICPHSKSVWIGWTDVERRIVVVMFHPDKREEAMMFKLMFG